MNLALLMTNKIILGSMIFNQVPVKLKEQVRTNLTEAGCEQLIVE